MPSAVEMNGRSDEDLVLTGMAGRLPESNNIEEFAEQLFAGVDLVTADDRRWKPGLHGLPERNGKLKDLVHFDATFFGVHGKQAHLMDPQLRILLEITHEALIDAGYNPTELKGSRTGVFVGVSNSETEERWTEEPDKITGYALTGCCRAMFPNRVSYTFDFRGPSYAIDTACSSSMFALSQAAAAIRAGHCDAAIVAGTNLCLKPANSLNFHRLSMLSPEGKCAAFDASGKGYVRSEAAVCVVLQKRSVARRVYATLRGARCNTDGNKEQGITFPSGAMQKTLADETFKEAGLRPSEVHYVEAHGTGTKVGDPQEVNAIADLFCAGRSKPLLLGSVKSNMGHSEPASGLCSIAKVLLACQKGVIPANLHYKEANKDIPALSDGRIQVVDKNMEWDGGLVAINSFGFGGANAHIILESEKSKAQKKQKTDLPRLVLTSGRTEAAVEYMLNHAAKHDDEGLYTLLDKIHSANIPGHDFRGYKLVNHTENVEEVMEFSGGDRRPIWWVFSGMGSQWAGAGRRLKAIPPFAASLAKSAAILKPLGLDLNKVLEDEKADLDDVLNCFVAIAAVQVALVDVLREIGVEPDGILGHSVGEIGCAYADGCLTAEQAVLTAFWRGKAVTGASLAPGAMAAVGLSWEKAGEVCPESVQPACHNSDDSVTVSGPPEEVDKLVASLSATGVFARKVASAGVAFHSKYIAAAAPPLESALKKIIKEDKVRTKRWLSTSVPEEQWDSELARTCSVKYLVNNLLSPVRFATALRKVPENAILVEIAPHALLQAVLKRSLPKTVSHVPLVRKDHPDSSIHLLSAIGKLYGAGGYPLAGRLYGRATLPVPLRTPGLGAAVRWDHAAEWSVASFHDANRGRELSVEVELSKPEHAYISGHRIDGRVLYPATGYLTLIWESIAKMYGKKPEETPIILENVNFLRATIVPKDQPVKFSLNILNGGGNFELIESGQVTVTGTARLVDEPDTETLNLNPPFVKQEQDILPLDKDDIYKELRLRGYEYQGLFQGIKSADGRGVAGELHWKDNYVSYMDTMLQFGIIATNTRELYLPTRLQRVLIDPLKQTKLLQGKEGDNVTLPVYHYPDLGVTVSGGVEIRGLKTSLAPRRTNAQAAPKLEKYEFVPYEKAATASTDPARAKRDAITTCVQLLLENVGTLRMKIAEKANDRAAEALLAPSVSEILELEPLVRCEATVAAGNSSANYATLAEKGFTVSQKENPEGTNHLVIGSDVLAREGIDTLELFINALDEKGLILLQEARDVLDEPAHKALLTRTKLRVLTRQKAGGVEFILLKKEKALPADKVVIETTHTDYSWVEDLKAAMKKAESEDLRIYAIGRGEASGVLGLGTCLRGEPGGNALRIYLLDEKAPKFSLDKEPFKSQLSLDAAVNVLRNNQWGCYRHFVLEDVSAATLAVRHAYVNTLTRGDLSSLRWIESPLQYYAETEEAKTTELCSVYCTPLNFRDIMLATGKLPPDALPGKLAGQECILGLEFSGRDSTGKRVMGMLAARGLATTVAVPPTFLWQVPDKWSLLEASTVPVAYSTAYYALKVRGKMSKGDKVLIHAGSGGVGQAAIAIALHEGCTVFTTVGTKDKRDFLKKTFPQLKDENIGNSRDTSFEQLVMRQTKGQGVDIVLNSLAADKLQASVRCLAVGGRFCEIGKLDLSQNSPLGMAVFLKNTTFHGILLDALFEDGSKAEDRDAVVKCMKEGLANGAIKPLPYTVFSNNQLEQAFRFMATGKHIGKVVVQLRDENDKPDKLLVQSIPRTYMHPTKTYVLVGGLGGFGLELGWWLVNRGATKLVFNSRSGVRTGYQAWCIRRWREQGIQVLVSTADTTTEKGAKQLMTESEKLGPVGGVFNLAAVLKDSFLDSQTPDTYRAVAKPKIDGTIALDVATRTLCPALEHFVVFSSVSCGRGNPGQSNYGFANSASERLAEKRRADSQPALAVQWGAIGDVGMVVALTAGSEDSVGGTMPQKIASCLNTLGYLLARPHAVTASMVLADKRKAPTASKQDLMAAVANILGLKDHTKVSATASLAELGMDSLMGAEIKQTLERGHDLVLGVQEIRTLTFAKLQELAGGAAAPSSSAPSATSPIGNTLVQLGELVPKQVMIKLPSQPANKPGVNPVFMVHPIEGTVDCLKTLASHIKGPVIGLQCTADAPLASLPELASYYVKHVRSTQPKPPYTLLGYSFGAGVAYEMALQLEKAGCSSRLVLVDGSPGFVAAHTTRGKARRPAAARSADADQADALAYFTQLFVPAIDDANKYSSELQKLPDWDSRVAKVCSTIGTNVAPTKVLGEAARSFYLKLVAADGYKPNTLLNGPSALFQATDNYIRQEDDYGMKKATKGPLTINRLSADHRSILIGDAAKTIAEYVSKLILE